MNNENYQKYGLSYYEDIAEYLKSVGKLFDVEIDDCMKAFQKKDSLKISHYQTLFQGSDKQFCLLRDAAQNCVHKSHTISLFMSQ